MSDIVGIQIRRLAQMREAHRQQLEIFHERNVLYGDAIRVGGVAGAVLELLACAARLHQLVILSEGHHYNKEVIRDTLLDAANYGSIGMMLLEEGNIWGGLNAPIGIDGNE